LEGSRLFKVEINTNNIHDTRLRWPRQAEQRLEKYVRDGGGLYILHSANNAFPHWKEYDKLIGLGWRPRSSGYALEVDSNKNIIRIPPGEGNGTGHGARFNAIIQILNRHPINNDYPEQWKTANTEVLIIREARPKILRYYRLLMTAQPRIAGGP
jgi:hypothetical protein